MKPLNYEVVLKNIRKELKKYIAKNHLQSLVLGVSGGIDSALVAAIVKPVCDEMGITIIGRSISIQTNKADEVLRAKMIGESFCHKFDEVSMETEYRVLRYINDADE